MEEFGDDFDVFKIVGAVGAEDGFFVAFAEDEDEVAFFGERESFFDGFLTVELDEKVFTESFASFFGALNELVGDGGGVFVTRVVFGDDDNVAIFTEDFAAEGAGGFVAPAGAAVKRDDFAGAL